MSVCRECPGDFPLGRRACIAAAIASVLPWTPGVAAAASPSKIHRVGVLDPDPAIHVETWKEFVADLARLGYVEGRNLVFERRFGAEDRPEGVKRFAAELAALKVDVIYAAHGTLSALAAKNATRTIPIVFFSSGDPVGQGLVASLSRPGGNITGSSISSFETFPKSLQYLKELVSKLARVVEISSSSTRSRPWFAQMDAAVQGAASRLGVKFEYVDVKSFDEVAPAVDRLVAGVDAVVVGSASVLAPHLQEMADLLIRKRLPSIGDPRDGFLFDYSPDYLAVARKGAEYVAKVLSGVRPSEIPVEQTSAFNLVVNQRTAEAIQLKIPEAMLLRASKVLR